MNSKQEETRSIDHGYEIWMHENILLVQISVL